MTPTVDKKFLAQKLEIFARSHHCHGVGGKQSPMTIKSTFFLLEIEEGWGELLKSDKMGQEDNHGREGDQTAHLPLRGLVGPLTTSSTGTVESKHT